jgi:hypothetical protein
VIQAIIENGRPLNFKNGEPFGKRPRNPVYFDESRATTIYALILVSRPTTVHRPIVVMAFFAMSAGIMPVIVDPIYAQFFGWSGSKIGKKCPE